MTKIRIIGGAPLQGKIRISGAKNAALPLMAASLLTDKPLVLNNLPNLADVQTLKHLLEHLGCKIEFGYDQENAHFGKIHALNIKSTEAPYEQVSKMRASVLVLGPLVARFGQAKVSLPGGCAIGIRPIDMHLRGLERMGATIYLEEGYVRVEAKKGLQGASYTFPKVTVTGTENLLMAATLAKGTTHLINAAQEPEVSDLAHCLVKMGAKIQGIGTSNLVIEGTDRLEGGVHTVLPDRIETGTYAMATVLTGGRVELTHTSLELMSCPLLLMESMGINIFPTSNGFIVTAPSERYKGLEVITEPYPGFPTDLQAQKMALVTLAEGSSIITETIWENRFMHVPELMRMGADITLKGNTAIVRGVSHLKGAPVMATDLRASVSLVMAGLVAQGETIISRIYHLDRGYEDIDNKLQACGAFIERLESK